MSPTARVVKVVLELNLEIRDKIAVRERVCVNAKECQLKPLRREKITADKHQSTLKVDN